MMRIQPKCLLIKKDVYKACGKSGFEMLEPTAKQLFAISALASPANIRHKDPFDRFLIAQAKTEGMQLITHDGKIAQYNEKCITSV